MPKTQSKQSKKVNTTSLFGAHIPTEKQRLANAKLASVGKSKRDFILQCVDQLIAPDSAQKVQ